MGTSGFTLRVFEPPDIERPYADPISRGDKLAQSGTLRTSPKGQNGTVEWVCSAPRADFRSATEARTRDVSVVTSAVGAQITALRRTASIARGTLPSVFFARALSNRPDD